MSAKKLPPFGKPLMDLQLQNLRPNNTVYVYIGTNAWAKGKARSVSYPTQTLVLPAYLSAYSYYWPVQQCDVLICDTAYCDASYVEELALCLYDHDAHVVRALSSDFTLTVYQKDLQNV